VIVSINQPAYLPWLGYFDRIDASDLHVVLDHVQFEKNSLVNRNKLRTPAGWTWITVPVSTKGQFENLAINMLQAADPGRWRTKHWRTIDANYARAPQFRAFGATLRSALETGSESADFLPVVETINRHILDRLGINTPLVHSSSMVLTQKKGDLVIEICKIVGATTYVSGPFGRDYLDLDAFRTAGIDVIFHDYAPPSYLQAWPGFEAGMSAVDALLCLPGNEARDVMRSGRRLTETSVTRREQT
jgi:hypothetical protein